MFDLMLFLGGGICVAALFGWWIRYTELRDAREAKLEADYLADLRKQPKIKAQERKRV